MENNEEVKQDDVILAIKEEYEKKLEEQKEQLNKEKEEALKQAEEKHIAQIRALMTGRNEGYCQERKEDKEELSFEDSVLQELKNKFNI